ncbi:hypothetical protein GCM10010172_23490 [Paractinoplanes ferrugineus]|uniref:Uncharacterized protein n=1 Tax=Paractinoplanes ferrugineus TaxID=113564 RepID=A0A919ITJ3_9ACTN|nr:hypothetical protein [Actinoplanes ferrugineus]GIE08740.1 hypothetical protein Afe05nite_05800 [Actinoplanes ferrugineus]
MSEPTFSWQQPGGSLSSGMVTAPGPPPATPPPTDPPPSAPKPEPTGPQRRRRQMLIFAGIAGGILAIGLTVILVLVFSSSTNPFSRKAAGPADVRPPLARACPPPNASPSAAPTQAPSVQPPESGARTVDPDAGISYKTYGAPWEPWNTVWRAGTLEVPYKVGQHFVTETYSGGQYHASILSAAVPATDNDGGIVDLECVGRQVAADVRAEYYPQPNTMETMRDGMTTLGGKPAYVNEFRLHFRSEGLTATDELSAVAVIDVGKPSAAVLYVSIPGTHKQFDYVIDDVFKSVRSP